MKKKNVDELSQGSKEKRWRWRVDLNSFLLILVLIVSASADKTIPWVRNYVLNYSSQYFCVHFQLLVMQGLTSDGGRSYLARIGKTKLFTFLGRPANNSHLSWNLDYSPNNFFGNE
jgi:hypothetical protein